MMKRLWSENVTLLFFPQVLPDWLSDSVYTSLTFPFGVEKSNSLHNSDLYPNQSHLSESPSFGTGTGPIAQVYSMKTM